ncbi:efflux RND transporter periplasmic adaptor subunit [Thermodesulfobacteriota bacterium]
MSTKPQEQPPAPTAGPQQPNGQPQGPPPVVDPAKRALAIGIELAKNATKARTLEELQFILVNDVRALIPFDRSLLIYHFDGESSLAAVHNQIKLEHKSDFVQRVNKLAPSLKGIDKGIIIFADAPVAETVPEYQATLLKGFMDYTKCSCLMLIPLTLRDHGVGHLLLEFYGDNAPGQLETSALINMVPFFSAALTEKWLISKKRGVRRAFEWALSPDRGLSRRVKFWIKLGIIVAVVLGLVYVSALNMTLTVGGKAEVAPDYEYFAFVEIDGLIQKVFVEEGHAVEKGQRLAVIESKDIDFKIREAKRMIESYSTEMEILTNLGAEDPTKLAESRLVAIKRQRAKYELDYLEWQRQFLEIRSPVDGVVLTERVESLVGKKFKAGEAFCTIAPHDVLVSDIFVRQSDVAYVKKGMKGEVFFDFEPRKKNEVTIENISPASVTIPELGSVFRVRAKFAAQPPNIKPGMQGIARIDTGTAKLWFVVTRKITMKINEMLLYF